MVLSCDKAAGHAHQRARARTKAGQGSDHKGSSTKIRRTLGFPEGPSSQYLRSLVPKTIPLMVFGPRVLKYCVLGPSGFL